MGRWLRFALLGSAILFGVGCVVALTASSAERAAPSRARASGTDGTGTSEGLGVSESRRLAAQPRVAPAAELFGPPVPTWVNALAIDRGGESALLSCGDTNGDSMLDGADGGRFAGVSVPLNPGGACLAPEAHRDYFAGGPTDYVTFSCDAARRPLLIVAIGGGGTELLDPLSGESFALVKIVNALQGATSVRGISSVPVLMTAAVFGADLPQMRMEQWLAADLVRKLDAMPCLRVLLIGHSHGGVTVSAVTAALDAPYGDRLYGILLDRTLALYDHVTHEFPARTRILNVFQTNEGWHGVPLARANILDVDASAEVAPLGPKRGGDVLATVDHTSLDDAAAVHRIIVGWTLTVLGND